MRVLALLTLAATLLSGCSLLPEKETAPSTSWPLHQADVAAMQQWDAYGKIGVRTAEDSLSATLDWQHDEPRYNIEIRGPLGQGSAKISSDGYYVTLDIPEEQSIAAGSAAELLEYRFGWQMPVEAVKYWIRGIPAPDSPFKATYADNKLATLEQHGWKIRYADYVTNAGQPSLPSKVVMSYEELRITLLVAEWQTR